MLGFVTVFFANIYYTNKVGPGTEALGQKNWFHLHLKSSRLDLTDIISLGSMKKILPLCPTTPSKHFITIFSAVCSGDFPHIGSYCFLLYLGIYTEFLGETTIFSSQH